MTGIPNPNQLATASSGARSLAEHQISDYRDGIVKKMLEETQIEAIDRWIKEQADPDLDRYSATRRLVEIGLTVGAKQKQTTAATADRANELASTAIDGLTASTPNNDEKASRKRRLIKGPEEFRGVRVDRPKAKGK